MHTILHKLRNGGVGSYPPNPQVIATMIGKGLAWPVEQIAWEISKMMEPVGEEAAANGKVAYTEAMATEWALALADGGLTEAEAIDLFTRRIQERNGYEENQLIDDMELPAQIRSDRYFRDAIVWDNTVTNRCRCDMSKAQIIHMDRIRTARYAAFKPLDAQYMQALESGDGVEQRRIAVLKQILRDIPQTFDLEQHTTPEELKAAWPAEIPRR